ncbi:MAG: SDR family oxidoreductase [Bacteroidota bacterium]|nr:SDR family oxidoreductase [Candidatus Kapabacteria bacterium]MDW8219755.1 SDR family oxidoreductase [Bacteroidota bacterium]
MTSLLNKIVWITGSSRGIGLASAIALATKGTRLILSSRNEEDLHHAARTVASVSGNPIAPLIVTCDITKPESIKNAWGLIQEQCGGVDILINNAGIGIFQPFVAMTVEEISLMLDANIRGALICAQVVMQHMQERRSGVIMSINSVAALKAFAGASVYAASKAALMAANRVIREEVRAHGVKVIDLFVGATETDIWSPADRAEFRSRMMQPEDVAAAVVSVLELPHRMMPEELVLRPQLGDV